MRSMARRLMRWFKSDEAGLTILAWLTIARGLSYLPPLLSQGRPPAHWLEGWATPAVWGAVWVATGLFCLVATRVGAWLPAAVGMAVGLHLAWAASYLLGTLAGDTARGWVSALNYLAVSLLALYAYSRERVQVLGRNNDEGE
ncbi:hypothetical protein [Corynebacterium lizhenjunii]|uniref:hypothetical protein n=1 Tax=Corynebacterium lizhenjunii TaxID=2709394 RepID=UPI0013EE35D2|nr:hypothetical protein [Corynebacterium lizhenjunii]